MKIDGLDGMYGGHVHAPMMARGKALYEAVVATCRYRYSIDVASKTVLSEGENGVCHVDYDGSRLADYDPDGVTIYPRHKMGNAEIDRLNALLYPLGARVIRSGFMAVAGQQKLVLLGETPVRLDYDGAYLGESPQLRAM